jgi:transposase
VLSSDDRVVLARLRRENRTQAMEIEISKEASAYFARENVLPTSGFGSLANLPLTGSPPR